MKLQLFQYVCEPLGHKFNAPALPFNTYGKFLLRDEGGTSISYLDALADSTYPEVSTLLRGLVETAHLTANKRADLLQRLYGEVACDPDDEGRAFIVGRHPKCPICASHTMRFWNEVVPDKFVDAEVPHVTHRHWQFLTEGQKLAKTKTWLCLNGLASRSST
ncbi:hypothetical protein HN018_12570 [Lichenicola cladoniae]|uniref:Uncharacterized protein n=1 Tax=Lichenicola cladoniae TaxID=1484109 RepID=A0A6M8HR59_9PROT|nr:hypothetical protein [Lichenicola cladoniae]NPD68816.1 hypothetical protein [Acetobacteraceae bacterium]QKE90765.1 hypothetical protein HN018_12570 [Lichenicola cladoniae]